MDVQMTMEDKNKKDSSSLIKCDVLIVTSAMQNQNGIKLNDYYRYSHFCSKKINKLRKLYKLTQGKRKFVRIDISSENVIDAKVLLIPILECERKWAKGMEMKQHMTSVGQDIKKLRYNISKKFKKSADCAKEFYELTKTISDTQTILEAEAYYSLFEANILIFKRKFDEALNLLKRAANIYEKISQIKDTIESITYKEKINAIKTSIRLCVYNLSTSKDVIFDEDEFQNSVNIDGEDNLLEKIEEIKKSSSLNVKEGESYEIKYQGMNIPIKNEKLKFSFAKVNDISNKIEQETDLSKKVNMFTDIFNLIDEIVKIIKKDKSEENQQTENFSKIYSKLLNYVQNLRLKKYIDKNLTYIKDYSQDLNNMNVLTDIIEKDNVKLRVKPQEMIKLYDNLLEYENQLINLEKENPDQSYIIDLSFRNKVYSVSKIFYVGLFYLLNKKYEDVYTIMHHILEKIKEINEYFENHNLSSISFLRELHSYIENLENLVRFIISKSYVKMAKDKFESTVKISNSNKMVVDGEVNVKKDKTKIKYHGWLYEEMQGNKEEITRENFELLKDNVKMSYEDYHESIEKTNFNNYSHIIQIPPNTKLIEPKPIIYDLAFLRFGYPNLEAKKKSAGKGILSRALGYFWNK